MLQRAASNAFSWWWASHIRTKQSKWLEQSLLDMEDKVHYALNIVQKDGDSFAKRAEMYYRHRPDLICFVEETFRAYRSLAERYDKLSKNLQKANTTIASLFPDQVSYDDFDDDDCPPRMPTRNMPTQNQGPNAAKIPKVPQLPSKDLKGLITNASKKMRVTKAFKEDNPARIVPKSGLSEEEALEEIDKVQKEILAMQTMKEFTKSMYENGLSKYWEIDSKINAMQQRVCRLEDEFKVSRVIEDGDARTVMAKAALKSCKETLEKLEEKRENSSQAARSEHERIVDAKQKIEALKRSFRPDQLDDSETGDVEKSRVLSQDDKNESVAKITEGLDLSNKPLTISRLADTIDRLSNEVIGLESSVSSQTANIDKLRVQTGELLTEIQKLEGDKTLDGKKVSKKLKILEKKLKGVEDLEKDVEKQNDSLKSCFVEAHCSIENLSEKLHDVQPDEEVETCSLAAEEENSMSDVEGTLNSEEDVLDETENRYMDEDDQVENESITKTKIDSNEGNEDKNANTGKKNHESKVKNANTVETKDETNNDNGVKKSKTKKKKDNSKDNDSKNVDIRKDETKTEERIVRTKNETGDDEGENVEEEEEESNDGSRKNPLKQYTTTLKNYKETKKKLSEEEKNKLGTLFELIVLVRELKTGMVKKDNEIQSLKQKLKQLQDDKEIDEPEPVSEDKEDEEINISIGEPEPISEIEEKLRTDIDAILDENLDFWLRFSTQFHQVQKFKTQVEDLQGEIVKVKAKTVEGKTTDSMFTTDLRSDIRPIYKHLKEIQSELILWLEQAEHLKEELQKRCSSLTNIQEEITMALKEGILEDEIKFSTHQAAKFQGEILNMEQENNRVNEELEAGLDHVRALHLETKKTLRKLEDEFGLTDNQNPYQQASSAQSPTRPGIPLRSFIFGVKAKKQKPSIFGVKARKQKQ